MRRKLRYQLLFYSFKGREEIEAAYIRIIDNNLYTRIRLGNIYMRLKH